MHPQQPKKQLVQLGTALAALLAISFLLLGREQAELEDQLRIERQHRHDLEGALKDRQAKLDGALDHIQRLTDERDAAE